MIFLVIICVVAMGLFWINSLRYSVDGSSTQNRQMISQGQIASSSPELTLEQKAAAYLGQEESNLIEWLTSELANTEFALSGLISIYERQGKSVKALELFKKLIERNPNNPNPYYRMGQIAQRKEDYNEAIRYWRKVLELNPNLPKVHIDIGNALISLGENAEAVKEIEEGIKASPGGQLSQNGYSLLGQAYLKLEEYEKARLDFEKSIEINPNNEIAAKSNYGLARLYAKLKQRDKAADYMGLYQRYIDNIKIKALSDKRHFSIFSISRTLALLYADTYKFCLRKGDKEKAEESFKNAEQIFENIISIAPDWSTGIAILLHFMSEPGGN